MKNRICNFFIRNTLADVGGIETYVYKSIVGIVQKGDCAGWITDDFSQINPVFKKIITLKNCYLIERAKAKYKLKNICAKRMYNTVNIITFSPMDFIYAERLKNKLKGLCVNTFLFIPHFQGDFLYLEEGFRSTFKGIIKKRLGHIYQKMEYNDNLLYFSKRHLQEFRNRYGCKENEYSNVRIPSIVSTRKEFDKTRVERVYNQDIFTILSVSRLDFPHKGYVLGLVDTFEKLSEKYSSLQLIIVGDGEDIEVLRKKINSLRVEVAQKIKVIGAVSPDELPDYYDKANVLISLAGCFSLGAKRGVLSLPARHYTENCEVYGYLPDSKDFSLSDSVGYDVMPYIEEIINMSFDEYLYKCQLCFDSYQDPVEKYFDQINNKTNSTLGLLDILFITILAIHNKLLFILRKVQLKMEKA